MPELARRIGRAKPSAIMVVAEKAKRLKSEGRDIISFSIGVPNFLPGDHVYAAAREALAKDTGQYGVAKQMVSPSSRRASARLKITCLAPMPVATFARSYPFRPICAM